MMRKKRLPALMALAVAFSVKAWAGTPYEVDVATTPPPATVAAGETVYVTNTNSSPEAKTIAGDFAVKDGGKAYFGFVGNDTAAASASIASGAIAIDVSGNVTIGGDTWVGKMKTGAGSMFPYPTFPDASSRDVTLNVGGDLTVAIDEGNGNHDGFMVFAGDGHSSKVLVAGDALVTGGHNHVYDNMGMGTTQAAEALLQARTFAMTGGSFEVIGSKALIRTTNTDSAVNAMTFGGDSEIMLMAGGVLDASAGGDILVDAGASMAGYFFLNADAGAVKLASGAHLKVARGGTLSLEAGSVTVSGAGSSVVIDGNLVLGYVSGSPFAPGVSAFTKLEGETVTITHAAAVRLSDAFIARALAAHTSGNAAVTVVGTTSGVSVEGWDSGDRTLLENFYGKFNFSKTANEITFKNVEKTDLTNASAAADAARTQAQRVFGATGADIRSLPKGFEKIVMGVAASSSGATIAGASAVSSDSSAAGDLNRAIWNGLVSGAETFAASGVAGGYTAGLSSMLGNGRGSGINSVAMGTALQARHSVENRIAANNSALARKRGVNSEQALASAAFASEYRNRLWAGSFGLWEDADRRKGVSGYKYNSYGVMLGYDRMFGPLTVGTAFGYTKGDYEDKAAQSHDSDITSYNASLYAAYNHCSGFFVSAIGGYTYSDNDINEFDGANWAREDFHTNTWNIGAKLGYDWRPTERVTITPSAGLFYTDAKNSRHGVAYGGVDLLTYGALKNHAASLPVEVAAGYNVTTGCGAAVNLSARVGYSYTFNDDAIEGDVFLNGLNGAGGLRASGRASGRHTFRTGAGVTYTHGRFDAGLRYDYFGKAGYDAHSLMAKVGLSF